MTQQDRQIVELKDRVKRLTKQCGELQAENKELRMINGKAFAVLREGL